MCFHHEATALSDIKINYSLAEMVIHIILENALVVTQLDWENPQQQRGFCSNSKENCNGTLVGDYGEDRWVSILQITSRHSTGLYLESILEELNIILLNGNLAACWKIWLNKLAYKTCLTW